MIDRDTADVWERAASCGRPICMYGMGNGGDKITAELERRGMIVSDYFASDGFVRGQSFHGKTVLSYGNVIEKYGDPLILLAFGSDRSEVLRRVLEISSEHELLAPDVPVAGEELFDREFFSEHYSELCEVRSMLCDERSEEVFDRVTEFKLTGDVRLLYGDDAGREDVFFGLLKPENYRAAADLGAYTGDTLKELLAVSADIGTVYALEPDRKTYRKLHEYVERENLGGRVIAIAAAAGREDGEATFFTQGNRNSSVSCKGNETVTVRALDSLADRPLDYIKFDVEGGERDAILGAVRVIKENRPDLVVSCYHRSRDLFDLPKLIKDLCPEYRFYLRRERCIPAWDVELVATVR